MEGLSSNKRVRDDSDELSESTEFTLPEVKRLRQDLFDGLDNSDLCTSSQDLDSFMKSFEDEIVGLSPAAVEVVDLESDSGESRPELGYLLEASDDELGLPPSISAETESDLVRVDSDSSELWRFDEQMSGYDSFDFGLGNTVGQYDSNSEFVALDGLFDYSEIGFGSSDLSWQHESLHAL